MAASTVLYQLLTIAILFHSSKYIFVTSSFDFFKLVFQWPNSVCKGLPCRRIPLPKDFTIHGLWPDNYTANLLYCNVHPPPSWPIQNVTLVQRLNTSWPDLLVSNTMSSQNFWSRQWHKHGSCSANLYQRDQYFEKALELRGRFDLLGILRQNLITPQLRNPFPTTKINVSIAGATGQVPILKCTNHNLLTEIVICFNPTGVSVISCPQPRTPNCPNYVFFP